MVNLLKNIYSKLFVWSRKVLAIYIKNKIIFGYSEYVREGASKRALVSYLVHPLLPPPSMREKAQFSNSGIAQEIYRALNELGYIVDIIDYQNSSWVPSIQYDLFIGHGGINFERIARQLGAQTTKIYFSTGLYWRELNIKEAARFYELALRKGVILPADRHASPDEEIANQLSDGIICLGNDNAAVSYSKFSNVYHLNNASFPFPAHMKAGKQHDQERKHFLFFSGRGNVHKGLDLLLESFEGTDLHLHICQHLESDFVKLYKDLLTNHPNIHNEGFVKMRSSKFEQLASLCNWIILPTCAEGQPGSVLECMSYGLIPVLSDEANIDLEDWGVRIKALDVAAIRFTIDSVSKMDPGECKSRSDKVRGAMLKYYTPCIFRDNFKKSVKNIVTSCQR